MTTATNTTTTLPEIETTDGRCPECGTPVVGLLACPGCGAVPEVELVEDGEQAERDAQQDDAEEAGRRATEDADAEEEQAEYEDAVDCGLEPPECELDEEEDEPDLDALDGDALRDHASEVYGIALDGDETDAEIRARCRATE